MASSPCLMVIVNKDMQPTPALARAVALAHKSRERLLLTSFEHDRVLARAAQQGFDLEAYLQGRRQKLEALAEPLRREGLSVETRLYWGRPLLAQVLLNVLIEQPQMVLKDAGTEPALKRRLFAPEDLDLLRQCPAPLMLVRHGARAMPKRILAAVDPLDEHDRPQELNERVLKLANRIAMQCNAQLDVVHAFEYVPPVIAGEVLSGWLPDMNLQEEVRTLHRDALNNLGREFGAPSARLHMLDGRPEQVIAEFAAQQQSDVVVMGTVQRNFLQRLALGSVAEGLLQRLDCDVLALKPEGFLEPLQAELEKVKFSDDLN